MNEIVVDALTPADLTEVLHFWRKIEGLGLNDVNAPEPLARYLSRNPGCSAAARHEGRLVGVSLAGHDGRRGFLHHVAVEPHLRNHGLARRMIEFCLTAIARDGVEKCHMLVFRENDGALSFLDKLGWERRDELLVLSKPLAGACP